jgi:hypothetical protein
MLDELSFPPAVLLGLWINAAQTGSISQTGSANAIEVITNQANFGTDTHGQDSEISSWLELVKVACASSTPVAVGLPTEGNPAGLPREVLADLDWNCGAVAINPRLLLRRNLVGIWVLSIVENTVPHYDLNQARRNLTEYVAVATTQLAASDLVGDETEVSRLLEAFQSMHLPPHLSKRSTDALESAAKIMIVARGAMSHSNALHSPSIDRRRLKTLAELIEKSRNVLQSVVTS